MAHSLGQGHAQIQRLLTVVLHVKGMQQRLDRVLQKHVQVSCHVTLSKTHVTSVYSLNIFTNHIPYECSLFYICFYNLKRNMLANI